MKRSNQLMEQILSTSTIPRNQLLFFGATQHKTTMPTASSVPKHGKLGSNLIFIIIPTMCSAYRNVTWDGRTWTSSQAGSSIASRLTLLFRVRLVATVATSSVGWWGGRFGDVTRRFETHVTTSCQNGTRGRIESGGWQWQLKETKH